MFERRDRDGTAILEFRMGEAFPASDPCARFVVSVGAALNDLLFLNGLYVPHERWGLMRREPTPSENIYLIRAIIASLFEFIVLLDKGRSNPSVRVLLDKVVSGDGHIDQTTIDNLSSFRADLKRTRDHTAHYPWPNSVALRNALDSVADQTGIMEASPESMSSIRAVFADEVLVQFLGTDDDDLRQFLTAVTDLVTGSVRLAQHIINAYFESLEADPVP